MCGVRNMHAVASLRWESCSGSWWLSVFSATAIQTNAGEAPCTASERSCAGQGVSSSKTRISAASAPAHWGVGGKATAAQVAGR